MVIHNVTINGFGNLNTRLSLASDRLNLIIDANEQGKSTFAAALFSALYGFSSERRSKNRPIVDEDRYAPWSGGAFEIIIEGAFGDHPFRLRRNFLDGSAELIDLQSHQDRADKYRTKQGYDFGGKLFGLNREQFQNTVLIQQSEIATLHDAAGLKDKLESLADSGGGDRTASAALEALRRSLEQYPGVMLKGPGRVETELTRLEERLQQVDEALAGIERRRAMAASEIGVLEELNRQLKELDEQRIRLEYLQDCAEAGEVSSRLQRHQDVLREIEQHEVESRALSRRADFPDHRRDVLVSLRERIMQEQARIERLDADRQILDRQMQEIKDRCAGFFPNASVEIPRDWDESLRLLQDRYRTASAKHAELESALKAEQEDLNLSTGDLNRCETLRRLFQTFTEKEKDSIAGYERERLRRERDQTMYENRASELHHAVEEIDRERLAAAGRGRLIAGIGFACLTGGAALWLNTAPVFWWAGICGLGVAAAVWGIVKILTAQSLFTDERASQKLEAGQIADHAHRLKEEWTSLHRNMQELAKQHGFQDEVALTQAFQEYGRLEGRTSKARQLREAMEQAEVEIRRFQAETRTYLDAVGEASGETDGTLEQAQRLAATVKRLRDADAHLERLRQDAARVQTDRDDTVTALHRHQLDIRALLDDAGIDASDDPEERIRQFETACREAERYRRLQREQLPALKKQRLSNEVITGLQNRRSALKKACMTVEQHHPALATLAPELTMGEYADQLRTIQSQVSAITAQREDMHQAIGRFLETSRTEIPALETEREKLQASLYRTRRFRDAVKLAEETLRNIAEERHRLWADQLNTSAGSILAQISPAYDQIYFGPDLQFAVRERFSGKRHDYPVIMHQLSSGARDQIYLSIRLALGDMLSRAEMPLPYIFDEPFLTSDDDRFLQGMKFLAGGLCERH